MLVTFSKTDYFIDKADQRGATYEAGKLFEEFLNQRLKSKTSRPCGVHPRQPRPDLQGPGGRARRHRGGESDHHPDRRERVDFSSPLVEVSGSES
jgi:hypothetical protein